MSAWAPPVRGGYVTSAYGQRRSPGGVGSTWHRGIDFGGRGTDWLVRSIGPGYVLARGVNAVRGRWVAIRHDDGSTTAYQHLATVTASGRVSAGTPLGRMGQTGTSTATHLHMECFPAGRFVLVGDAFASTDRAVDPEPFARARGVELRTGAVLVTNPVSGGGGALPSPSTSHIPGIQEDDMFTDNDRTMLANIYSGLYVGGPSVDAPTPGSIVDLIAQAPRKAWWTTTVDRDGQQVPVIQELADSKTLGQAVLALSQALTQRGVADVDEGALAAALAPLLRANVAALSDADLSRIAKAAADETDRRQRDRLSR